MSKVDILRLDSVTANDTTATLLINTNFQNIQQELENTLSRDGKTPNFMDANLDMNSYKIINAGIAENDNDVLTLKQFNDMAGDVADNVAAVRDTVTRVETLAQSALVSSNSAIAAVRQAENTLSVASDLLEETQEYVDGVKDEIDSTKEEAITTIDNKIAEAEASIDETIDEAVEDVKREAVAAAQAAIDDAAETVTQTAQANIDSYVTDTVEPDLQEYVAEAKDWANKTSGTVDGSEYSAKYYANLSANSATTSAAQASTATTQAGIATTKAGEASTSASNAASSASNASQSATAAAQSETNALNYKNEAKQYAVGLPTEPEEKSAKWWAEHSGLPDQTGQSGKVLMTDGLGTYWGQSAADGDGITINTNNQGKTQAIGVINQNNTSNAVKTWTGTKAQYDAIVTKDPNTLYNITDDTDVSLTILEALYPVGSVYITTANTCPLSALISGSTWTLVSSGIVTAGNIPCKGNGMTLGMTGVQNGGLVDWGTSGSRNISITTQGYGQPLNTHTAKRTIASGDQNTIGLTTDASKSGIIADTSSLTLSVNIYERKA